MLKGEAIDLPFGAELLSRIFDWRLMRDKGRL